ncbi:MAG: MFS transporter [Rubrobacteraceae bacterium]
MSAADQRTAEGSNNLGRIVGAGVSGSFLEWYEFGVYAYVATTLAASFFPQSDPAAGLLATFGIFATGYLMRPVGAIVLGHVGDHYSRKAGLIVSVSLMTVATGAMAFLPTYQSIGILAPVLLTVLRLVQGFAVGGEYTGSIVLLAESAPPNRRALLACLALVSGTLGVMAASGAAALFTVLLTSEQFSAWGWRLLYAPTPLLGIVGLFLRRRLTASLDLRPSRLPIVAVMRQHRTALLKVIGLVAALAVGNYTTLVYGATYLTTTVGVKASEALTATTVGNFALVVSALTSAVLTDRFGRRPVMLGAASALLALAYPLYALLHSSTWSPVLTMTCFGLLVGLVGGALAVWMTEIFPRAVRYTGVSLGYGLAIGILGGTTPLIATTGLDITRDPLFPALYIMLAAAVTLVTAYFTPETKGKPI